MSEQTPIDYEALLAAEGMPAELSEDERVIAAGDALQVNDPVTAAEREARAAAEQIGDNAWRAAGGEAPDA